MPRKPLVSVSDRHGGPPVNPRKTVLPVQPLGAFLAYFTAKQVGEWEPAFRRVLGDPDPPPNERKSNDSQTTFLLTFSAERKGADHLSLSGSVIGYLLRKHKKC